MKKFFLVGLITIMSCAKEPIKNLAPKKRLVNPISNQLTSNNWRMEYNIINGVATMGDNSVWKFSNAGHTATHTNGYEVAYNGWLNGSRIYIEQGDSVNEYFIDYLSTDSMFISSVNIRYSFVNAQ